MKNSRVINFCPTGMVPRKEDNPNVPISASEIIEDVHRAFELGITIAHIHARDNNGNPDWRPEAHAPIIDGIRKHCKGLVICLSTSGRKEKEFDKRSAVIEMRPDMCSLTLGSLNFMNQSSENSPEMIDHLLLKMLEYEVLPEFECFSAGMVNYGNYLKKKHKIQAVSYWNILFGNIFTAQPALTEMGVFLDKIDPDDIVAVAGLGKFQLQTNAIGLAAGYGVRVGLEDNLYFDNNRKKLASNIELLKRIHEIMKIHEITCMKPEEFREITAVKNCS